MGLPVTVGDYNGYARNFGHLLARKYDMGTQVAVMIQQGANALQCVRVTDGTDVAASIAVLTNCITFTSLHS